MLKELNLEQKQAVKHGSGPLLIIAGAGTGKTKVITQRIAFLLDKKLALPEEILALTFTDKAAEEMESRVDVLLPYGLVNTWISTFHAFGDRILREEAILAGLSPEFQVMSKTDQVLFFRDNIAKFKLKILKPVTNPTKNIEALIDIISRAKDENVPTDEYLAYAKKLKQKANSKEDKKEALLQTEIASAYATYEKLKKKQSILDFSDQVYLTYHLLKDNPQVLKKYQKQFKYVLVDEFQDTNYLQSELVKLLAKPQDNITVVGDDDQCLPKNTLINTKSGRKKIKDIKVDDKVLTAVGKGHLGFSGVKRKFVNKKKARFLKLTTKHGHKIEVTDNHKMFCHTPRISKSNFWYIYLMEKNDVGWRLGITKDLAARLRLERSADRIIAINAYSNEQEARYYENLYSLRYSIPTVCFQTERQGLALDQELLKKLYKQLDVDKGVKRLAQDLHIDLSAHHHALQGVTRGNKRRVKLYLDMCYRNYRSKKRKHKILANPKINHLLQLETSNKKVIAKLRQAGFILSKAKKGWRLRTANINIVELGKKMKKIQSLIDCVTEIRCIIGKVNKKNLPSLVMPAKNIKLGMYVPIISKNEVIYDQVIKIKEQIKTNVVYDLEINRTHNFVANNIVVHNSIYKFRGASIANIMQFKKDHPKAKQVVLVDNYRSTQKILDSAYTGIKHNDPDRLEVKNQIDKKLISQTKVGKKPKFKVFDQIQAEADSIAQEIKKQVEKPKTSYSDIAILVRGNSYAQHFIQALNSANIPWVFSGASGLYQESEVQLLTAFIKSVASNGDNLALYRLAESFIYQLNPNDLIECLDQARYSHNSLFWIMKQAKNNKRLNITKNGLETIEQIIQDLEQYRELAKKKTAGQILFQFLTEKKILELLTKRQTVKSETQIKNIAEFFNRVKDFEQVVKQKTIQHLSEYLDSIIEAGESPEIEDFDPNLEAVSVLTVHAAKGLEFKTVFLPSLTHDRFPSYRRGKGLELPDIFIKEVLPKGDFHTQEERRLFYVAMTRAKENLNLSFSYNCEGQRKKRPSPFIGEALGQEVIEKINQEKASAVKQIELFAQPKALEPKPAEQKLETVYLTAYKIDDYKTCPFKYKYVNILHLPVIDNFQIVFGSAMHNTIQQFLTQKKAGKLLTLKQLLPIFYRYWRSKGFYSKGHELEAKEQAKVSLQSFITQETKRTLPTSIEESFSLKYKNSLIRGRWDAAYQTSEGLEIIDFKSSDIPDPEKAKNRVRDSLQLDLYAWGYQEKYNKLPDRLGLYFLTSGNRVYREPTEKTMAKIKKIVEKTSQGIINQEFTPTPSSFACRYCSYSQICPYAIRK